MGADGRGARQPRDDVAAAAPPRLAAQQQTLTARERDEATRAAWRKEGATIDPADLICLDATSTHTAFTRRRARAPRGERAVGSVPRNHGPNVTLLATLTPTGSGPALAVEGATDRPVFEAFVARCLVPSLRPGQVVVLDNLSAHKGARIGELIETAGCRLLFLPAYSPDCNPIELAFKIKQHLRSAAARSFDALLSAMGDALDAITPAHARGFYAHCGFTLTDQ